FEGKLGWSQAGQYEAEKARLNKSVEPLYARFNGMKPERIVQLDAELRQLPVTDADRVARCARYDNEVPKFDLPPGKPLRILLFEKINGFKDEPSVKAANAAIHAMAARKGWAIAATDKGGAINRRTLGQFDVVIWNNISGDVLTLSQRAALRRWIERGGGFVAMHGSAGDFVYWWDWYPDRLIGARFMGHPMNPQFQEARLVTNTAHPLAAGLPAEWRMTDEWYSFRTNPRSVGANVLLTLDETTYKPEGNGQNLRMGEDHPIAWTNCIGKGRMFYSAIGHRPETYTEPNHLRMLESAITWAATARKACPARG
ncbi:MAG: ThuA domain-containing protein, partial [Novosphingobium sp.]|nr:ThuA domain-containing protein [Novosphingobium sp.]